MKKHWKVLSILGISVMLVSACGTEEDVEPETNQQGEEQKQPEDQQGSKDVTPKPEEEEEIEKDVANQRPAEKEMTYLHEGMEQVATGILYESTEQPFSLYTLPNYLASPEEPGKDIVLYDLNDKIYMQIEVQPEDVDWAVVEQQATDQLKSVNTDVQKSEATFIEKAFPNSKALYASNDEVIVHKLIVKANAKQPNMMLTIHTTIEGDAMEPILAMAKTIEKVE